MGIEESVFTPPPVQLTFPGLYRGIVKQNDDRPQSAGGDAEDEFGPLGRLRVLIPQVYGEDLQDEDLPWAWPCFPQGGLMKDEISQGLVAIPEVDAQVWVAFEQGDPQNPVWMGTCYGAPERNSDTTELPKTVTDEDEEEKTRTGTEYPELIVWQGRGPEDKQKAMMIRFVADKRIDIYLDEDNYIELDNTGNTEAQEPPQIRVHSTDYRVKVDSDVEVQLKSPLVKIDASDGTFEVSAQDIRLTAEGTVRVSAASIFGGGIVQGTFRHPVA